MAEAEVIDLGIEVINPGATPGPVTVTPEAAIINANAYRTSLLLLAERGHEPIGVNQPEGGSLFPFIRPVGEDIANLLADVYLAYDDPVCQFTEPFRLAWLYGFGQEYVSPPDGVPEPTHEFDVLVVDADNRTVFDSTLAQTFRKQVWGDRLLILEWLKDGEVLRVVQFLTWSSDETPRTYHDHILPTAADLDSRCLERLPPRVQSIQVGLTTLREAIQLVNGYNTTLVVDTPTATDGGVAGSSILVGAAPGSGRGRYDGCLDQEVYIRRIAGAAGDAQGNLRLDATGNYRLERPSTLDEDTVPSTAAFEPATLQLHNDGSPCCECEDFVNTYQAITNLWHQYQDMGDLAEDVRDRFAILLSQWSDRQNDCYDRRFRLGLVASGSQVLSIQVVLCNTTGATLHNVPVVVDIDYTGCFMDSEGEGEEEEEPEAVPNAGLICGQTIITGDADLPSSGNVFAAGELLEGAFSVYNYTFGRILPGARGTLSFQVKFFPDRCPAPVEVTVTAKATLNAGEDDEELLLRVATITTRLDLEFC